MFFISQTTALHTESTPINSMPHLNSVEVDVISDDDEHPCDTVSPFFTPVACKLKKSRIDPEGNNTVLVIDDDPTPQKPSVGLSAPSSVVPETPVSAMPDAAAAIIRCTRVDPVPQSIHAVHSFTDHNNGVNGLICIDSDSESDRGGSVPDYGEPHFQGASSLDCHNQISDDSCIRESERADVCMASGCPRKKRKPTKEQKMEEKRKLKEREKIEKAAVRAEAVKAKVRRKFEKGKLALKSIAVEIDRKVVETGSVGGHLLTRLSDKGLKFRITSNPFEGSILWSMVVPEEISPAPSSRSVQIPYVLLVYEAGHFCDQIQSSSFLDHVRRVRTHYPSHTICCLTNRLMSYIHKREKVQYNNPSADRVWRSPPAEETFSELATQFVRVHSRQCIDEAEVADHVSALTSSLASCQYRKKLTRLSVNANGLIVPKDSVNKNLIKKNTWLKALVVIPKVQPRFAIAVWKKYPTMKSLLTVYMDPKRSVHEKESLLEDLPAEGLVSADTRLGQACSKRIYRVLMAQSPSTLTDDVELGADFFTT